MEEGRSRKREVRRLEQVRRLVQMRLDGGLTHVERVKMHQVDRSNLRVSR